jgi:hypothetical protein
LTQQPLQMLMAEKQGSALMVTCRRLLSPAVTLGCQMLGQQPWQMMTLQQQQQLLPHCLKVAPALCLL